MNDRKALGLDLLFILFCGIAITLLIEKGLHEGFDITRILGIVLIGSIGTFLFFHMLNEWSVHKNTYVLLMFLHLMNEGYSLDQLLLENPPQSALEKLGDRLTALNNEIVEWYERRDVL